MERIYVVEDDDNIRDLIRIALEGFGYVVSAFEMTPLKISRQISRTWRCLT